MRQSKNEMREIDCLCCREVDAMLTASAKIRERQGSISPSSFYGHLPDYLSYVLALSTKTMSFSFGSWSSWTKQGGWANLRFYLFVSGVNQMEWEREVSPKFPFVNPEVCEVPLRPTASEVAWFSVRSSCRWLSQCWLIFVSLVVDATLSDRGGIWYNVRSFR